MNRTFGRADAVSAERATAGTTSVRARTRARDEGVSRGMTVLRCEFPSIGGRGRGLAGGRRPGLAPAADDLGGLEGPPLVVALLDPMFQRPPQALLRRSVLGLAREVVDLERVVL